jgi:hypothetical protein
MSPERAPPQITGHRNLSDLELVLANEAKELANKCGKFIDNLMKLNDDHQLTLVDVDWLYAGEMDMKKAWMCVVRSITKPTSF